MNCERWRGQLEPFLDGELSPAETRALDIHLQDCAACSANALSRARLKRAVHVAGRRFVAPPGLRLRVQQQIAQEPHRRWQRAWMPALAGLAAVMALALAASLMGGGSSRPQFQEIADLHTTALASSSRVDVVSSDRHTVKPWFQGKLPFSFNLPELAGTDFTLVGGRAAFVEQQPAAHLVFQSKKHLFSAFILREGPETKSSFGKESAGRQASFSTATWTQDGLRYVVISDASEAQVKALMELLQKAGA
jgi:anti-sigma factor RsiW